MMSDTQESPSWYGGFRRWVPEREGGNVVHIHPLLAEMIGAGVIAAESAESRWKGGGNHKGWDVCGDGINIDVKNAWRHKDGVLGIPPPPKATGQYDPAVVHEIALVVLGDFTEDHEYLPDGTVTLAARARAEAVYRVPVATMNAKMWRDGKSTARWLIKASDISAFLVRGDP